MRRPWIVVALMAFAVIGAALIFTAEEDSGPVLVEVVTEQGLATRVPEGWVASEEVPFEFGPPDSSQPFDQWTVARACPPDGCRERSMAEWLALAEDLPTFDDLANADDTIFDVVAEDLDDARVLRAQTEASGRLVFVAAFTDGAASYVACSVRISIGGDHDLADAVVDVCRATDPVDEDP